MAQVSTIAMALASPTPSVDVPKVPDAGENNTGFSVDEKLAAALLTPPNSISPELPAHPTHASDQSPPPINIEHETGLQDDGDGQVAQHQVLSSETAGTPLSKGALSGLDASAAISPGMLAKHHLPGIMLGNGPRPIRYVMGELTQSVPGFSRIPPPKARRLVVAALESRGGGGPDGSVAFCKTGWGRWDAHIKGSSKDSGIGSFNDGHTSPPRSERSSYSLSNGDSAVHMPRPRMSSAYREQHSGGSWTASSLREEDELEMEMNVPENEADKMSLDASMDDDGSSSTNDATDEEDWAAVGPEALRKASLPPPGAPRKNYNAISYQGRRPSRGWSRRSPGTYRRPLQSTSLPQSSFFNSPPELGIDPALATPEEKAAVAALMSLGST